MFLLTHSTCLCQWEQGTECRQDSCAKDLHSNIFLLATCSLFDEKLLNFMKRNYPNVTLGFFSGISVGWIITLPEKDSSKWNHWHSAIWTEVICWLAQMHWVLNLVTDLDAESVSSLASNVQICWDSLAQDLKPRWFQQTFSACKGGSVILVFKLFLLHCFW